MRELLRKIQAVLHRGQVDEQLDMVYEIEAFLATPEPYAMEIAQKIADDCMVLSNPDCINSYDMEVDVPAAATLIRGYGRRVPRSFVEEVYRLGYRSAVEDGAWKLSYDAIAAKYGVKVEGAR